MAAMHQQAESVVRARTVAIAFAALAIALGIGWFARRDPTPRRTVQRSHPVRFDLDAWMLPHVDTTHVEVFQMR
jgi:hypothetical protein